MHFKKFLATALILLAFTASASAAEYFVSPNGLGDHNGSSPANAFSLSEAMANASAMPNVELTYLLASGSYGSFTDLNPVERTAWVTWRANEPGVEFDTIKYEVAGENYREIWHIFDGLTVRYGNPRIGKNANLGVYMQHVGHTKFLNMTFVGNGYVQDSGKTAIGFGASNDAVVDNCTIYGETDVPGGGI